jgi:hypothetical protein
MTFVVGNEIWVSNDEVEELPGLKLSCELSASELSTLTVGTVTVCMEGEMLLSSAKRFAGEGVIMTDQRGRAARPTGLDMPNMR